MSTIYISIDNSLIKWILHIGTNIKEELIWNG